MKRRIIIVMISIAFLCTGIVQAAENPAPEAQQKSNGNEAVIAGVPSPSPVSEMPVMKPVQKKEIKNAAKEKVDKKAAKKAAKEKAKKDKAAKKAAKEKAKKDKAAKEKAKKGQKK